MGCGSSKNVQVSDREQQPAKPTKRNKECIDQENGEPIIGGACSNANSPEKAGNESGVQPVKTTDVDIIEKEIVNELTAQINANNEATKPSSTLSSSHWNDPSETTITARPASGSHGHVADNGQEEKVAFTPTGKIDYHELFLIIQNSVYLSDIQETINLRHKNADLLDEIHFVNTQGNHTPPPIIEDEDNLENPRRKRPERNYDRERANAISLEVKTVFGILKNGGVYQNDSTETKKLQKENANLRNRLETAKEKS